MASIIICAGALRSGSTWQFNVVRTIFNQFSTKKIYSCWVKDMDPSVDADVLIVKIHENKDLIKFSADKVLTSYRDLRSVVISLHRMGWVDSNNLTQVSEWLDKYINDLSQIELVADRSTKYEIMMRNRIGEISRLSSLLGFDLKFVDVRKIDDVVQSIKNPTEINDGIGHDPISLLHEGHISSDNFDYDRKLPELTGNYIVSKYGSWLKQRGYL